MAAAVYRASGKLAPGLSAADHLSHQCGRIGGWAVTGPGDKLIRAYEHEARAVFHPLILVTVTDHAQRHAERRCSFLERIDRRIVDPECEQREASPQLLIDISPRGEGQRREVMS